VSGSPSVAPAAPLRVAFAGTPPFAAASLRALDEAGHVVPLVLTQPDRPGGRGMRLQPSAVKRYALAHDLPLAQPRGLRLDGRWADDAGAARDALQRAAPDVLVVAAYGLILPRWVLALPRLGAINVHASLLPRWRGAAPIVRAIEAGDPESGITLMQMDEGLDTGAMLARAVEPIRPDDTAQTLHDRLATLGASMLPALLGDAAAGRLAPVPQPDIGVTYAHKIDKGEAGLDWTRPAVELERQVRAFDPFPGATFSLGDDTTKVWQARAVPGEAAPPGTVLAGPPGTCRVACGEGALELLELQRPGGRRNAAATHFRSWPLAAGTRLALPPIAG
jgi:methionyl-tRNA formyltransferase